MKAQEFNKPEVSLSWIIEEDDYSREHNLTTLSSSKGREQLINTILMLIDQHKEMRIGADGYCLILEANDADPEFTDASYQWVDDYHFVGEYNSQKDDNDEEIETNE